MKITLLFASLLLAISSCQPSAQKINYGKQSCDFCRMSIVDDRYAAQLVNSKSRAYSFDAIECLLHFKKENADQQWALELVTNYAEPGQLTDANHCQYIRSKKLPSPMGMYLTAVQTPNQAEVLTSEFGGALFNYSTVLIQWEQWAEL